MKIITILILLVNLFIAEASTEAPAAIPTSWDLISTEKEIQVYRGEVPGSPVVAFRGISSLDAPIINVLSVIYDVSRIKEWLSDVKELKVLERKNNFDKIEYNRTKAPWPVSDRDFVYAVNVKVNSADKSIEIFIQSTEHPLAPSPKGVVRGELHASRYFLQSIEDGSKTHLTVEIFADPKGILPKWMVNMVQKSWPINTISGIRKIATEKNYQIHPDVARAMEQK